MSTITEKISKIIEKIDENIEKKLDKGDVETLLYEIDDKLAEIKKSAENAEEKQKEVVDKKVKELKGKINEGIDNEWGWGRVKKTLENNVKSGLEELKKEIEELEKPLQMVPFNSGSLSLVAPGNRTDSEELVMWRKVFNGQSPEFVYGHVERLEKFLVETNSVLKESKLVDKVDVQKLSESISGSAETYLRLAKEAGDASGLGLIVTPIASIVGVGGAVTHGMVVAGTSYVLETQKDVIGALGHHGDNAEKLAEKAMESAKSVVETGIKIFDVGGAAKGIASSLGESIGSTEKAKAERDVKIAEANAKARVEEIENLKKQLEELRKEKEKQVEELKEEHKNQTKELKERIQKKDDRIEKLEEKIEKLEARLDKAQNNLVAEIQVNRAPSPSGQ